MAANDWTRSKMWNVAHDCNRCKRAAGNGVFYEPDEVRHRRDEHEFKAIGMSRRDVELLQARTKAQEAMYGR